MTASWSTGYQRYMQSREWKARREIALAQSGHRCTGCASTDLLEVHHLTYERLGFERPTDLMVLCTHCHALEHGRAPRGGLPIAGPSAGDFARYAAARDHARRYRPLMPYVLNVERELDALQERLLADQRLDRDLKRTIRQVRLPLERLKAQLAV